MYFAKLNISGRGMIKVIKGRHNSTNIIFTTSHKHCSLTSAPFNYLKPQNFLHREGIHSVFIFRWPALDQAICIHKHNYFYYSYFFKFCRAVSHTKIYKSSILYQLLLLNLFLSVNHNTEAIKNITKTKEIWVQLNILV